MNKFMLILLLAINVSRCLGTGTKCRGEPCASFRECKDGCLCQSRGSGSTTCRDRNTDSCPAMDVCRMERATCNVQWKDGAGSRNRDVTINGYKFGGKTFGDALLAAMKGENGGYEAVTAGNIFNTIKSTDRGLTVRVNGVLQGAANSKAILDTQVPMTANGHLILIQSHKTNRLAAHREIDNKMEDSFSASAKDHFAEEDRESLVSSPVNQYYSFRSNEKGSDGHHHDSTSTDTNTLFMIIVVLLVVIIGCFACIFTGIAGIFIGKSLNKSNDTVAGYRKMDQIDHSI